MIVITMYNEDDILLGRTLKGVFKTSNIWNLKLVHRLGERFMEENCCMYCQ